jgi:hypothetical protein
MQLKVENDRLFLESALRERALQEDPEVVRFISG